MSQMPYQNNRTRSIVCGIDEAGRGPLAGPVCAAAVVLNRDFPTDILADSKKLKPKDREEARLVIIEQSLAWGVGWASHSEIDEINILKASLLAMRRAFGCLTAVCPDEANGIWPKNINSEKSFGKPFNNAAVPDKLEAIVDGTHCPELPVPCTAIVKADGKIHAVMAASILAKTARDFLMEHYAKLYPVYGYERHKGYPTAEHRKLVLEHGFSAIQRKSFRVG